MPQFPNKSRILKEGDIVSLDLGLKHKGLFTDHAVTVAVGKISKKDQQLMSVALFIAALMSINHWVHPTYSWRRIADHISSKTLFMIFFVNGLFVFYLCSYPILPTIVLGSTQASNSSGVT
jgi:methionine aminopeptidase